MNRWANDRLKLYLSVLQTAFEHAEQQENAALDLSGEFAAARVDASWLRELPANASLADGTLLVPSLPRVVERLAVDLQTMAKPLLEGGQRAEALDERLRYWLDWLHALHGERFLPAQLQLLTRGQGTKGADSLHLLVMDLHRQLNRLAGELSSEEIDGAHTSTNLRATLHRDSALTCVNRAAAALRSLERTGEGVAGTRIRVRGCRAATNPFSAFTSPVRSAHDIHSGR